MQMRRDRVVRNRFNALAGKKVVGGSDCGGSFKEIGVAANGMAFRGWLRFTLVTKHVGCIKGVLMQRAASSGVARASMHSRGPIVTVPGCGSVRS